MKLNPTGAEPSPSTSLDLPNLTDQTPSPTNKLFGLDRNEVIGYSVLVATVIAGYQITSWSIHLAHKYKLCESIMSWCLKGKVSKWDEKRNRDEARKRDEVFTRTLDPELWREIGKRLVCRLSILRFRSVCKQWRSSLPPPTRFPFRVPPPPSYECDDPDEAFFITEVNIYSLYLLDRWGITNVAFEEVDRGSKFRVRYLDPRCVKFVCPKISFTTEYPYSSRICFLSKAYHLRMASPRGQGEWELQQHTNKFAQKMVIISSNPTDCVNPCYARVTDLSVVAHLSWGRMKGRLALLRLGESAENWDWDTDFCTQVFQDICTFRGRLCALDHSGRVFLMDYKSLQMTQIAPPSPMISEVEKKHMFENRGKLFVVDLDHMMTYKLSFRCQMWIQAKSMGELLVGIIPYLF